MNAANCASESLGISWFTRPIVFLRRPRYRHQQFARYDRWLEYLCVTELFLEERVVLALHRERIPEMHLLLVLVDHHAERIPLWDIRVVHSARDHLVIVPDDLLEVQDVRYDDLLLTRHRAYPSSPSFGRGPGSPSHSYR